jgi:acyl-coenzyme A thioesterase PaaI-like protein
MIGDKPLAKLVKFFTEAPSSIYLPEDISITFGEARIRFSPASSDLDATGYVDRALYIKIMSDAANLAAGSLIDTHFVVAESFNAYAMKAVREDTRLAAVARLIQAQENNYTVEVRLLDDNGIAVASGMGVFSIGSTPLEEDASDAQHRDTEDPPDEPEIAYGSIWRTPFGYLHLN